MTDTPKDERADPLKDARMGLDPKLLQNLVCPKTRGALTYDKQAGELISKKAKLAYPIRSGVPIMLVEEARDLKGKG